MARDPAETPSPQPLPPAGGADARMSRLHEALKQLKAKGATSGAAAMGEPGEPAFQVEEPDLAAAPGSDAPAASSDAPVASMVAPCESVDAPVALQEAPLLTDDALAALFESPPQSSMSAPVVSEATWPEPFELPQLEPSVQALAAPRLDELIADYSLAETPAPESDFSAEADEATSPESEGSTPSTPLADARETWGETESEEPEGLQSQVVPAETVAIAAPDNLRKRAAALQEAEALAAQLFSARPVATLASHSSQAVESPAAEKIAAPEELFAACDSLAGAALRPPSLEDCLTAKACQQLDRLVGAILSPLPAGAPAAVAIAAVDAWRDAAGIAKRLAWRLAEQKQGDVLLISRDQVASRSERLAPSWGLADVVTGRAEWSEAIAPSEVAGLYLLGPGSPLPPEDVPSRDQWRSAMKQLKQRFRYIATDLRANLGEDTAWAAAFDGVYLAVELHCTPRETAAQATAALKHGGAAVRGCIALD
ncbi:MAG TPA: hypothetical protein VHC19_01525 [Pirellulales bacterium]|nr:hypothetical protein [Pirellulales bacterium]